MRQKKETKKSRPRLLPLLLFLLVAVLLLATVGSRRFSLPQKLALETMGAAQYALSRVTYFFSGLKDDYLGLIRVREENRQLRRQIDTLKVQLNKYREAAATNITLRGLLQLRETVATPTVTAEIIGRDPSVLFKTLVINRGSKVGLCQGMPAVTADGVVGQIIDSTPNYAKVLLAIDPNSAINVVVQRSRVQGILKGDGNEYTLHYVLKNADIREGDIIVTAGMEGLFPNGLMVGTVSKVVRGKRGRFQRIRVRPSVDFSHLETLLIILSERPFPQ